MKKYYYRIFGLNIESEIELPDLPFDHSYPIDVVIKYGKIPRHIVNAKNKGVLYESKQNDFLFRLENVSSYRVQNGNTITVQPNEKATSEEIRLFLLGSTMGGLLHQRGILPIHGSAVEKDNKALIIAGASSSGKSSLAAGMSELGYSIISDDISVIEFQNENKVMVQPGTPYLKLWNDVLSYFKEDPNLTKVRPNLDKYYLPKKTVTPNKAIPLEKIIALSVKNSSGFVHRKIHGAQKFELLRNNTYRLQYSEPFEQSKLQFFNLTKLANSVEIYKLERPISPLQVNELASFIHKNIFVF